METNMFWVILITSMVVAVAPRHLLSSWCCQSTLCFNFLCCFSSSCFVLRRKSFNESEARPMLSIFCSSFSLSSTPSLYVEYVEGKTRGDSDRNISPLFVCTFLPQCIGVCLHNLPVAFFKFCWFDNLKFLLRLIFPLFTRENTYLIFSYTL